MAKRLWDKGETIDAGVHHFTVGSDPEIDLHIARWDVLGSAAQTQVLFQNGTLSHAEAQALMKALQEVLLEIDAGLFQIPRELEDCHSTLEAKLTEREPEAGKKIHTGRSRNDQVLVTLRLFLKQSNLKISQALLPLVDVLLSRHANLAALPMPGYTHFQRAMPSTVGMWLQSYMEDFGDLLRQGAALAEHLDSCPLGVGSGFGVPLDMKRSLSAKLLGFARVQRNPMHVQNSRGRVEVLLLRWCGDIAAVIEKLACDLMLFTTEEYGFVKLPAGLTTGSSIMPQKRNPDVVELLRAGASRVRASAFEIEQIIAKLPSSYHRDFQNTKEPLVRGIEVLFSMLTATQAVLRDMTFQEDALRRAEAAPELYATFEAYRLAREGQPFREAYQMAAKNYQEKKLDLSALKTEFAPIQAELENEHREFQAEFAQTRKQLQTKAEAFAKMQTEIFNLLEKK